MVRSHATRSSAIGFHGVHVGSGDRLVHFPAMSERTKPPPPRYRLKLLASIGISPFTIEAHASTGS
ncbi:hypothetical protein KCP78_07810 [Salmonella enterica subsp. enterica]|nr:hypothetical protein KCP78_07810 [Salmonella enterica subsp. enterica]